MAKKKSLTKTRYSIQSGSALNRARVLSIFSSIYQSKYNMNFLRPARLLLTSVLLIVVAVPALAQSEVEVIDQSAGYLFGSFLQFDVEFESEKVILEGSVFYQFEGNDRIWVYEADVSSDRAMSVRVLLDPANAIPAFSTVNYWFLFGSDHGEFFESPRYSFYYEDNRYPWQTASIPPFSVVWHNGNQAFAESILAAAQLGVLRLQDMLPLAAPAGITIRVYDNVDDVQMLASLAGYEWAAGHTDPQHALILVSLPPGAQQSLEVQRQVPHEVAHLMLYQGLGAEGYANLPAWLDEGLASAAEIYSDPLNAQLLEAANVSNGLLPMYTLCATFPQDAGSARLAYAQSASFVHYLHEKYNSVGLGLLVDAYAASGDCLAAPRETFGKDMLALENDWRNEVFGPAALPDWVQQVPWQSMLISAGVALFLGILVRRLGRQK
jgi:hypothetical protein